MTTWDAFIAEKIKILAQSETVHDIGGGAAPRDASLFKEYIVIDVNAEYHPDIVGDIQALPFADQSLSAIICLSVLEHVENPFIATAELYRVLKPGGNILLSAPFIWPYHGNKFYKDYWRFSKDGIELLFKSFSKVEMVKGGGYFSTVVSLVPAYLRLARFLRPIASFVDNRWKVGKSNFPEYFIFLTK